MPDPHLEIRGARSSRPLDKGGGEGGLQKKKFRSFGPQFGLKIKGGRAPWAPPLYLLLLATAKESDEGANLLCPSQSDSGSL